MLNILLILQIVLMDRLSALLNYFKPTIQCVQHSVFESGDGFAHEAHEFADIYLMAKGQLTLFVEGEATQTLSEGDVVWLPNGNAHHVQANSNTVEFVHAILVFGSVGLNPLLESMPSCIVLKGDEASSRELDPLSQLIISETRNPRCGNELVLNHLAEVLLVKMLRFLMQRMVFDQGLIGGLGDPRLARALTAMHDQPGESWTVDKLAKEAGMSRTAFSAHFHKVLGYPPAEYLSSWRMRLASDWLGNTTQSVGQIADKLGYQNEASFRRAFRKVTGHAPGWVRKQAAIQPVTSP